MQYDRDALDSGSTSSTPTGHYTLPVESRTTAALRTELQQVVAGVKRHKRNVFELSRLTLSKTHELRELTFVEVGDGSSGQRGALFKVLAYDIGRGDALGAEVARARPPREEYHALAFTGVAGTGAPNAPPHSLALRPQAGARLVLPLYRHAADGTAQPSTGDSSAPVFFEIRVLMQPLVNAVTGSAAGAGRYAGAVGRARDADIKLLHSASKTLLRGCVPLSDAALMRSGFYDASEMLHCSTSGATVTFTVDSVAHDAQGRVRPVALLHSITFSTQSIFTSNDLPTWPLTVARCLCPASVDGGASDSTSRPAPDDARLLQHLRDNYTAINKLLQRKRSLELHLGGDADMDSDDGIDAASRAPSRVPYQLQTTRMLSSTTTQRRARPGASTQRFRNGAVDDNDSSCVVS
jgi:hypothetical protein